MKKLLYLVIVLCAISLNAQDRKQPVAGPMPKVLVKEPKQFELKNGLKVLVVEDHKLPKVRFTLTMDNMPYAEASKKGVSDLVSAMLGNGTTTMSKDKYNEAVDFIGASVSFGSESAYASGLSRYTEKILDLMVDGAFNPLFTAEELESQKARMIETLKSDEKNVKTVSSRVNGVLTYGKNHYNGEYITKESINSITLEDVKVQYTKYFVPGKAYLIVSGDVEFKKIKKLIKKKFSSWNKALAPELEYSDPVDVQYSQVNFIDMPNAVQSEIAIVNLMKLKLSDQDFFAAKIANQILGGGGEARLYLNLREAHGWTYGAYSRVGSGRYINSFTASTSVRNMVTDSSVVEMINEIERINKEFVTDKELNTAKAKYIGNFVMNTQKASTIANFALNKELYQLSDDFYETYIQKINAVTKEDVLRAAKKYFKKDQLRIIIVGKASEVLLPLEKTCKKIGLPIFYFDKFGEKCERPKIERKIPEGVTAKTVLTSYLDAIGGKDNLDNINTLAVFSKANLQGQEMNLVVKSTKNKMCVEMKAMGMTVMRQVINDKEVYMEQQGQRMEMPEDKQEAMREVAGNFKEQGLINSDKVKLVGIETLEDHDCYVLSFGEMKLYYDLKSGLKIAEVVDVEQLGAKRTIATYYQDYKLAGGIKYPYKTIMDVGMRLEFITSEVKINEGVESADFN